MEKHYSNNKIEIRQLEEGYQIEILVINYKDSKILYDKTIDL